MRWVSLTGALGLATLGGCAVVYGYGDYVEVEPVEGPAPEPCQTVEDCPGVDTPCGVRVCEGGYCALTPTAAAGAELPVQIPGDCKVLLCGEDGFPVEREDTDDPEIDGYECTRDVCHDGVTAHTPEDSTTHCGAPGAPTHCDGQGNCVGCSAISDCGAPGPCVTVDCVDNACATTVLEGMECAPAYCSDDIYYSPSYCQSNGSCDWSGEQAPCAPYACGSVACRDMCQSDTDCAGGYVCGKATAACGCMSCNHWHMTGAQAMFCETSQERAQALTECAQAHCCFNGGSPCATAGVCSWQSTSMPPDAACQGCLLASCNVAYLECTGDGAL